LGAFLAGFSIRTSVQAGMSLAQIGEFSFIIAGLGPALRRCDSRRAGPRKSWSGPRRTSQGHRKTTSRAEFRVVSAPDVFGS
jgi:Kef-type K+ transport system membrane component KefB